MPLTIGVAWAAIFAYLFFRTSKRGGKRQGWIYLVIGLIGLAIGLALTLNVEL